MFTGLLGAVLRRCLAAGWWRSAAALLALVLSAGSARAAAMHPLDDPRTPVAAAPVAVAPCIRGQPAAVSARQAHRRITAVILDSAVLACPTPRQGAAGGPRAP
jgi:hypothetical protein